MPKGRQVGITWLELAAMLWAGDLLGPSPLPHRQAVRRVRQRGDHAAAHPGRLRPHSEPGKLRVLPESPLPRSGGPDRR